MTTPETKDSIYEAAMLLTHLVQHVADALTIIATRHPSAAADIDDLTQETTRCLTNIRENL